ncbi:MAG: FAD-dependent oxidoreductase [Pseudomonadota bacterium]
MTQHTVIVGAGHGAGQVVASLKQKGYDGEVTLIGDEAWLPYQRPPLSKKFLSGDLPAERLLFKPEAFYDDVTVRLNERVERIEPGNKTLTTRSGDPVAYGTLVLATGSSVRRLVCDGADLQGIHYLRSIADVDAIRADMPEGARVAIVGAGYIGLEVAAVARSLGHEVTVVEMADRVMSRVVSKDVSAFFDRVHRERGVDLRLMTGLVAFHGDGGRVTGIETNAGEMIDADLVVVGIGISPNDQLARDAGLDVDDGIVVDDHCRTSDPAIFAIGDCTRHPNAIYQDTLRLESVHNALEQAKTAAENIVGGDAHYNQVPWFWSDQYEFKLQIAGLSTAYDDVVLRGSPDDDSFSCVYLKDGRFIAIDCINAPKDFMQAKSVIAGLPCIPRETLANTALTFKDIQASLAEA